MSDKLSKQIESSIATYSENLVALNTLVAKETDGVKSNFLDLQTTMEQTKESINDQKKRFFRFEGIKKTAFITACVCQPLLLLLLVYLAFIH